MTKEDAARRLGVGVRTLQRMMSAGEIEYTTKPNPRGGSVAVFDEAEIERCRSERERRPPVVHPAASTALQSPALRSPGRDATAAGLEEALNRFVEALSKRDTTGPVDRRIWLTREQAVELAGLSRSVVFAAVASGALPSIRLSGRYYRVRRSDLVSWARRFTL